MARHKSLIAILLALAVLVSVPVDVFADDPTNPNQIGGGNTNDGHPWDDDVVESGPPPGTDPNTPGQNGTVANLPGVTVPPSVATIGSGAGAVAGIARMVFGRWLSVVEAKKLGRSTQVQRKR